MHSMHESLRAGIMMLLLVACAHGVDRSTFEAALGRWTNTEEEFYRSYKAGQPYPKVATVAPPIVASKGDVPTNSAHDATAEPTVVDKIDAIEDSSDMPTDRIKATARPVPSTTKPSSQGKYRSFSEVCGEDSANRCNDANPFNATFCLVSKKETLSIECRSYVTAKVNCYLSTTKFCAGESSHLKCLYNNRYHRALPALCTRTGFFEYVRSGVSFKDVLLDEEAS